MASASGLLPRPSAPSTASAATPASAGLSRLRRRFAAVARRQAITGPMPESSTSTSASGTV